MFFLPIVLRSGRVFVTANALCRYNIVLTSNRKPLYSERRNDRTRKTHCVHTFFIRKFTRETTNDVQSDIILSIVIFPIAGTSLLTIFAHLWWRKNQQNSAGVLTAVAALNGVCGSCSN